MRGRRHANSNAMPKTMIMVGSRPMSDSALPCRTVSAASSWSEGVESIPYRGTEWLDCCE